MIETLSHLFCRGLFRASIDAFYYLPGQGVLNGAAGHSTAFAMGVWTFAVLG